MQNLSMKGNQTPMMQEGTRTPIVNKINMSQDYVSWLKYQQNIAQTNQSTNNKQGHNINQDKLSDQIDFKRKIEKVDERKIFCVDRNAVNTTPLKYTFDQPLKHLCDQQEDFNHIFQQYGHKSQVENNYQSEKIQVITELQPDDEDQPFEDYQDFLIQDSHQNYTNLNVQQQSNNVTQHQQTIQNTNTNQKFQEYQPTVIKQEENVQPQQQNVIVMLPKSSREDVISNKVQSDSVLHQEGTSQEFNNLQSNLDISNNLQYQNENADNLLLSTQDHKYDQKSYTYHKDQYQNTLDYNQQDQVIHNQNYEYQQRLLQSDDQYDPVQSILNKYQYQQDAPQNTQTHTVQEHKTIYTEKITNQDNYQNHHYLQPAQETSTKKFVIIDGQRIPYDEYYKNKNQGNVTRVNQDQNNQKVRTYNSQNIQQQEYNYQPQYQNTQQETKNRKVNFQVAEQTKPENHQPSQAYQNETEKLQRLQYIKEQLKIKEQEQQELNKRINYIKGELDHEKMLKKSIDDQEKSLVEELNTKSQQIDQLKFQNEQLRQKISQHYTETPKKELQQSNKIDNLIDSKKLHTINEESVEDNNNSLHINKFDTFGQMDSMHKFQPMNSNSKKRDLSPGTNLRKKNELIPSQTIPKDYRPPTYDSVDQQQFSRLYNQTNND